MIHKPGIYFGLPAEEYHADQSLSKSGIAKLLDSPEQFWHESWMNPDRPAEDPSKAVERGTLWHCRILESTEFNKRYKIAPWCLEGFSDNYRVLKTVQDMKDYLTEGGVEFKSSGNKRYFEDMIIGSEGVFLEDYEKEKMEEAAKIGGQTLLYSKEIVDDMLFAERKMREHPYFSKVFKKGQAEVSIFWVDDETKIPMKCRVDMLNPGAILDYKTISFRRGKSIDRAVLDAIRYERHDIQAAKYTIGVAHAVNMLNDGTGVIEGDVPGSFIDEFKKQPEKPFGFVFQQSERPCAIRGRRVVRRGNDIYNVFGAGLFYMQAGIQIYQDYMEKFGPDKPWVDAEGFREIMDNEIYYNF